MKIDYAQSSVAQGRLNQFKAQETPNTFSTQNGVDQITQSQKLDKPKQRMAGQYGHRLLEYLNDPAENQRTEEWMDMFGMSNEGVQFNQAKMGVPAEEEL